MSRKREIENEARKRRLESEIERAPHVNNDVDLKTAMGQKKLVIISSDPKLYERLLSKLPKENISSGSKKLGSFLVGVGVAISVASAGLFSFIGIPLAGAGAILGTTGLVLDDYKDYSLFLDYNSKEVIFVKVKGNPCLELPHGNSKKLNR